MTEVETRPDDEMSPKKKIGDVVGGFTVLHDKTRRKKTQVWEVLPHWMSQPTPISEDLSRLVAVNCVPELSPEMRDRLKTAGISTLFPVQSTVIPAILQSYNYSYNFMRPRDFCVSAPTGSGKTLAYVIPIIQLLIGRQHPAVRALVVLPVRDLAKQVFTVFQKFLQGTDLEAVLLVGEKSLVKEQADLVKMDAEGNIVGRADIVVCTPGRLVDHLWNTDGFDLLRLRILVIDEADRVIADEKQNWFRLVDRRIYRSIDEEDDDSTGVNSSSQLEDEEAAVESVGRRHRPMLNVADQMNGLRDVTLQKILLSATLTHDPEPLKEFHLMFPRLFAVSGITSAHKAAPLPAPPPLEDVAVKEEEEREPAEVVAGDDVKMEVEEDNAGAAAGVGLFSTPQGLKEHYVCLRPESKPLFVVHLVRKLAQNRILCFTNSREDTHRLCLLLTTFRDLQVAEISARLPLVKRERLIAQFTKGEVQVLVCTDAMARGIDVEGVSCVVSYDRPTSVKTYVHRVGRTARAGREGVAYTLLAQNQVHHFKKDLSSVGKTHIHECKFHTSHARKYNREYQEALKTLQGSVKDEKMSTVFGQVTHQERCKSGSGKGKGNKPEPLEKSS